MKQECCPRLDPEPWDKKTLTWTNKRFAKDKVFCLFHVPITFGRTMKRLMRKVDAAGATCPDALCLSDHTSKWSMDVYLSVDKDLPGAEMQTLSGNYLSRVYEGPFSQTGTWCKDFASYAAEKGVKTGKMFMWYTTCPKCAKKYGRNYVAILAEIVG